jgi:hypothetical protein
MPQRVLMTRMSHGQAAMTADPSSVASQKIKMEWRSVPWKRRVVLDGFNVLIDLGVTARLKTVDTFKTRRKTSTVPPRRTTRFRALPSPLHGCSLTCAIGSIRLDCDHCRFRTGVAQSAPWERTMSQKRYRSVVAIGVGFRSHFSCCIKQ